VILYLWPELAGASKVTVGFRARYAMDAKAAASVLWDYYNPDAMVEVAPVRFRVE
jgi:hypothetical protein